MKVCVLFSGGKDSTFALFKALHAGHEVACLLTVKPENPDSFMFHSLNIELTELQAEAAELPLIIVPSKGEKEKEVLDLKQAILELKKSQKIEGVVAGAVASNYQKERVERICKQLKLELVALLWHKNQEKLLKEVLKEGFEVLITGVYAGGLNEKWVGRMLDEKALRELIALKEKFDFSLVGEGGEFETLVVNAPFFKKRLKIVESERHWDGVRGELKIKKAVLVEK